MDLERFDELCRELKKAVLAIERCEIELGEVGEVVLTVILNRTAVV